MSSVTITCPRCKEEIRIDTSTVNVVCPSCQCKMLLKRRAVVKKVPADTVQKPALQPEEKKEIPPISAPVTEKPVAPEKPQQIQTEPEQAVKPAAKKRPPTLREDPPVDPSTLRQETDPEDEIHTYMYPHYTARGEDALRKGDFLMQSGDYEHALNAFRRAASEMPDDYRSRWGITTAMLHHLQHFLSIQYDAFNPIPLERICNQQLAEAESEMEAVRSLAPSDRLVMLEEAYSYEVHDATRALAQAKKVCRRNLRKKHNYPLRFVLFFIALLLIATGIVCAFLLPLELPGRLMIGTAAIAVGILSAVLAFRI